jgi:DNA-binding NarL/FixJ family response regulator
MSKVRILIADDHVLIRRGLMATLAERPDWSIVAEASDGRQACELGARHAPDIAVLDLSMPERNGLDVTRELRSSTPKTRILIVTAHESEQLIREVLDAGAMGYVLKSDAGRVLVQAVEALLDERPFFTTKVAHFVLDGYLRTGGGKSRPMAAVTLSPRERHIVQLLAEGSNSKEVARTLHLSVKTVETHRSNIMRKMGFHSLADLVRYAIRNNIVDA